MMLTREFLTKIPLEGYVRRAMAICEDGFTLSIQASEVHYCTPRITMANGNVYTEVEVGFPSDEEPDLMEYAEEPDKPTETVYGYVPIDILDSVLLKHGGIKGVTLD